MHGKSKTKLGIGIIGCGNISMTYLRNAALFGGVELHRLRRHFGRHGRAPRQRNTASARLASMRC